MWIAFINMEYLRCMAGGNDMRNTIDNNGCHTPANLLLEQEQYMHLVEQGQ